MGKQDLQEQLVLRVPEDFLASLDFLVLKDIEVCTGFSFIFQ